MSDEHDVMPEGPGSGDRPEPDVAATRSGLPRPALIGLGLAAAIVLVLAAIILR